MKRLWAPWRMAYLKKHSDAVPCFMCSAHRSRKDASTFVLARGTHCLAMLNRYPYTNGHAMVAPLAHKGSLDELSDEETLELMNMTRDVQAAIGRAFKPQGYNLGINLGRVAGAGLLGHLHLHVVPRWNGDTNFMPATADTRVMPMSLRDAWKAIRKHLGGRR